MIKGLRPSLAEGGKIKIGGLGETRQSRSGGSYRVPQKYDHFLLTGTGRDQAGDLAQNVGLMDALVAAGYGDPDGCLRTLPILLHADEIDEVFPTTYAAYAGKRLVCHGDGETAHRWELKDGQRIGDGTDVQCPCEQLEAKRCKPHGTLHCSIALAQQAIAGSVYRWRTTSIISIQQMIGSFLQIQRVCGVLSGIPLVLRVSPMTVTPTDASGKQQTSTVYVCHVELRSTDLATVQQQVLAMAQMRNTVAGELARTRVEYRALVRAPADDNETSAEQGEVAMEFHPAARSTEGDRVYEILGAKAEAVPAPVVEPPSAPVMVDVPNPAQPATVIDAEPARDPEIAEKAAAFVPPVMREVSREPPPPANARQQAQAQANLDRERLALQAEAARVAAEARHAQELEEVRRQERLTAQARVETERVRSEVARVEALRVAAEQAEAASDQESVPPPPPPVTPDLETLWLAASKERGGHWIDAVRTALGFEGKAISSLTGKMKGRMSRALSRAAELGKSPVPHSTEWEAYVSLLITAAE